MLTVCHRRLELSETEETKLDKYCFLEVRINLWYWLRRDRKEDLPRAEWVRFQRFSARRIVDLKARRVGVNQGLDLDLRLGSYYKKVTIYTKFGQLVIRKIIEIVATRFHI